MLMYYVNNRGCCLLEPRYCILSFSVSLKLVYKTKFITNKGICNHAYCTYIKETINFSTGRALEIQSSCDLEETTW